jgi:hypothetical protein
MTGGNDDICAAHPASSCCLNPWRSVQNMLLSSGDGWFQRMIELQNHNKLCKVLISTRNNAFSNMYLPWQSHQDSSVQVYTNRGKLNLSRRCRESHTGPGTKLVQIQVDEVQLGQGA